MWVSYDLDFAFVFRSIPAHYSTDDSEVAFSCQSHTFHQPVIENGLRCSNGRQNVFYIGTANFHLERYSTNLCWISLIIRSCYGQHFHYSCKQQTQQIAQCPILRSKRHSINIVTKLHQFVPRLRWFHLCCSCNSIAEIIPDQISQRGYTIHPIVRKKYPALLYLQAIYEFVKFSSNSAEYISYKNHFNCTHDFYWTAIKIHSVRFFE